MLVHSNQNFHIWIRRITLSLRTILLVLLLTPVSTIFISSLSIFISLKTGTVRSAAQLSGVVVLVYLLSMQSLSHLYIESALFAVAHLVVLLLISVMVMNLSLRLFKKVLYSVK